MQESEKQFNPAHPENSDIHQAKKTGPERTWVEEAPPATTGGVNAPESIIEEEKGVKKEGADIILEKAEAQKQRGYLEIMWEAKDEFPKKMQELLRKKIFEKKGIIKEDLSYFDRERGVWWRDRFGVNFEFRNKPEVMPEREKNKMAKSKGKKEEHVSRSQIFKNRHMLELNLALSSLDRGEAVEKFQENRKIVYCDEKSDGFYVVESGMKKEISMGDILSDYEWGIKYVPDGEMPHYVFRKLAKRILVNETRRDVEEIYNHELLSANPDAAAPFPRSYRWGENFKEGSIGNIAETMSREVLARVSSNENLGFVVWRANSVEDGLYKYDFKLHTSKRKRGVEIEDEKNYEHLIKKLGIQFTIGKMKGKAAKVAKAKKIYGEKIPVNDIIIIAIRTKEFRDAFLRWLKDGRPSGGPEQFLSKSLKIRLLKKATQGLVKIKDEDIERLFSEKEEVENMEKLAA